MATTAEGTSGTTVISVVKPTPMWATWVFRIVFILNGIALFIILGHPAIPDSVKVRWSLYLTGLDRAVWAITRALGVQVDRDYNVPSGYRGNP